MFYKIKEVEPCHSCFRTVL